MIERLKIPRVYPGQCEILRFAILPRLRWGDAYTRITSSTRDELGVVIRAESEVRASDRDEAKAFFRNGVHDLPMIQQSHLCHNYRSDRCPICDLLDPSSGIRNTSWYPIISPEPFWAVNAYFLDNNPDLIAGRVLVVNLTRAMVEKLPNPWGRDWLRGPSFRGTLDAEDVPNGFFELTITNKQGENNVDSYWIRNPNISDLFQPNILYQRTRLCDMFPNINAPMIARGTAIRDQMRDAIMDRLVTNTIKTRKRGVGLTGITGPTGVTGVAGPTGVTGIAGPASSTSRGPRSFTVSIIDPADVGDAKRYLASLSSDLSDELGRYNDIIQNNMPDLPDEADAVDNMTEEELLEKLREKRRKRLGEAPGGVRNIDDIGKRRLDL